VKDSTCEGDNVICCLHNVCTALFLHFHQLIVNATFESRLRVSLKTFPGILLSLKHSFSYFTVNWILHAITCTILSKDFTLVGICMYVCILAYYTLLHARFGPSDLDFLARQN
jgi:hypothetical protein